METADDRSIWQIAVGLGLPDEAGAGSLDSEEIHPVASMLEQCVYAVEGSPNQIPCETGFGQINELAEAAARIHGDSFDIATTPVECSVTLYATDPKSTRFCGK